MSLKQVAPWLLSVLVFLVYLFSPNATPFDSRWTVHTALSLIHEHNADLNEYVPLLQADKWYAIECTLPGGTRLHRISDAQQCAGGHLYHFYPVAVPVMIAPLIAAMEGTLEILRHPFAGRVREGPRREFLSGNFAASSMITELVLASLVVTLAVLVVYFFARELAGWRSALAVALILAFCTSAWSIGSRALWMHGFSMLLLPAGLWAVWRGRWSLAGAIFMLAFFARPTNVVGLSFAGLWALREGRRATLAFAIGCLPVLAFFVGMNLWMYQSWLAPYFLVKRVGSSSLGLHPRMGEALLGDLISPGRGILVYTPLVIFSALGAWQWIRDRDPKHRALGLYLAAVWLAHYVLICLFEDWYGGDCYGPRYLSDLSSLFAIALLPVFRMRRLVQWAAIPALAVSLFMHAQGATCWPCVAWNNDPTRLAESPWRLWDWRDPAFLRNFRQR